MNKNIVLIGAMGSGKTSVGRRLSCDLKKDFFDSDFEIISNTGVSIEYIFDIEGESGFRTRETKVLTNLMNIKNIVIATGGGIVTQQRNLELLNLAIVVYLYANIDTLVDRCSKSNLRPLINKAIDKRQTIKDIVAIRDPLYRQAADIIIDTTGKRLYAIINNIKEELKKIN